LEVVLYFPLGLKRLKSRVWDRCVCNYCVVKSVWEICPMTFRSNLGRFYTWNAVVTILWNELGHISNPKCSRLKRYEPLLVENDVISLELSSSLIWWKRDIKSRNKKYFALPTWSKISSIKLNKTTFQ